jgi:hypothetical protein
MSYDVRIIIYSKADIVNRCCSIAASFPLAGKISGNKRILRHLTGKIYNNIESCCLYKVTMVGALFNEIYIIATGESY